MTIKNLLHIDGSTVAFKDSYFRELDNGDDKRIGYPESWRSVRRLESVARRVAEGTWCCQYCGEPFEMERNAHATRCRKTSLCRTMAYFARWRAWHEQVYQSAKQDYERTLRAFGPDDERPGLQSIWSGPHRAAAHVVKTRDRPTARATKPHFSLHLRPWADRLLGSQPDY